MSFLTYYNDNHGSGDQDLMSFIKTEQWEDADFAARTDPLTISWTLEASNFYGDQAPVVKVLPIHIACQKQPPASFLCTMHDIHPEGFLTKDSVYKRLPLHVACMSDAPNESVLRMIQLCSKAVKQKDVLGRLPIHYSCVNPSMEPVVIRLLELYPRSAEVADKQGFLPIHIACKSGLSVDVIRLLVDTAPATLERKTKKGSTPYKFAKSMKGDHQQQVIDIVSQKRV
eukprot:scaffold345_cov134-Cylindrotheca_fusiformis.AAC.39